MLWRLAVLTTAAHALAPKRYRLRPRNAVDPIRPEIGSPAPLVINALVAMERGASAARAEAPRSIATNALITRGAGLPISGRIGSTALRGRKR